MEIGYMINTNLAEDEQLMLELYSVSAPWVPSARPLIFNFSAVLRKAGSCS